MLLGINSQSVKSHDEAKTLLKTALKSGKIRIKYLPMRLNEKIDGVCRVGTDNKEKLSKAKIFYEKVNSC